MLILNRKPGQCIRIGDAITIHIEESRRTGRVKLRIDAPKDVPVVRCELVDKVPDKA